MSCGEKLCRGIAALDCKISVDDLLLALSTVDNFVVLEEQTMTRGILLHPTHFDLTMT